MWNEKQIIAWLRRDRNSAVIGDDAAVLPATPGADYLVTTDLFVEGVHFNKSLISAADAGRRALNRAVSDIAAVGGKPAWVFLSLALPRSFDDAWVRGFLQGFRSAARSVGLALAGGDTGSSGSKVFLADVIVCGSVPRGTAVLRSGARAGDILFVSGLLGATAAALENDRPLPAVHPRLKLGEQLRRKRWASAMIDVSDGLSTDLAHLCEESGVGAEIQAARVPLAGTLEQALHGGEDYELLFAVHARDAGRVPARIAGVRITRIGRFVKQRGMWIVDDRGRRKLAARGWEHFR